MNRGFRPGVYKVVAIAGLAAAMLVGTALAAGAVRPAPGTTDTQGHFEFSDVQGYTAAGSGTNCGAYSPGATFSFNVNVFNNDTSAADQKFNLQVWKMTQLDSSKCFTEAQLETMVQNGVTSAQTQSVDTDTASVHFAPGQPQPAQAGSSQRVSLSTSALTACAYYQFDTALSGSGPLSPGAGHVVPPVSGFILVRGCASTAPAGGGVGGATTTTSTKSATLANTGGGPLSMAPYLALLLLGVLGLISGGWLLRPRRR
jgi:hypothetical protein